MQAEFDRLMLEVDLEVDRALALDCGPDQLEPEAAGPEPQGEAVNYGGIRHGVKRRLSPGWVESSGERAPYTFSSADEEAEWLSTGALLWLSIHDRTGACPSYELTLYEDGRVAYVGHEHVRALGARQWQLDLERIDRVREILAMLPVARHDLNPVFTHAGWGETPCDFSREFVYQVEGDARVLMHSVEGDTWGAPSCLRHLEYALLRSLGLWRYTGSDFLGDSPTRPSGAADPQTFPQAQVTSLDDLPW